jgi:hypothetical protein
MVDGAPDVLFARTWNTERPRLKHLLSVCSHCREGGKSSAHLAGGRSMGAGLGRRLPDCAAGPRTIEGWGRLRLCAHHQQRWCPDLTACACQTCPHREMPPRARPCYHARRQLVLLPRSGQPSASAALRTLLRGLAGLPARSRDQPASRQRRRGGSEAATASTAARLTQAGRLHGAMTGLLGWSGTSPAAQALRAHMCSLSMLDRGPPTRAAKGQHRSDVDQDLRQRQMLRVGYRPAAGQSGCAHECRLHVT